MGDYTVENAEGAALFAMDRVTNAIQMMTEFSDELRRRLRECEEARNSEHRAYIAQRRESERMSETIIRLNTRVDELVGENGELRDENVALRAAAEEL